MLDKHSIYAAIGRTKKKFSGYFSGDQKSFELGRQKVPLMLHLNIAILTQHCTQIRILSSDKSFLWKGFTAAEPERLYVIRLNIGILTCGYHLSRTGVLHQHI